MVKENSSHQEGEKDYVFISFSSDSIDASSLVILDSDSERCKSGIL